MLTVNWDEKRDGYWVTGLGFNFFAYFTCDFDVDGKERETFLECDNVKRENEPFVLHLQIPINQPTGQFGIEYVETQIENILRQYWVLS
jgi:hypothetical protein